MVGRARKNLNCLRNVEISLQDVTDMNFENCSIDTCLCMANTFGNLGDKKIPALREMKRVTNPGGNIVLGVYSAGAMPCRIESYENAGMKVDILDNKTVLSDDGLKLEEFSKEELIQIFARAGLNYKISALNGISYTCLLSRP